MRGRLLAGLAAAAVLGVGGCSTDPPTSALSGGTAVRLQADVLVVTRSAAAHDWAAVRGELQVLRTDLASARSSGTVTAARAASIEAAIAAVSSDLPAVVPSTRQSTPAQRTTAPSPPAPRTTVTTIAPKKKPPKSDEHGAKGGGD